MKTLAGLLLSGLLFLTASATAADAPPPSAMSKNVEALVTKAAAEIDKRGAASFADFHKKGSEWLQGETYIFVYNLEGIVLVNGAFPQNEGLDTQKPGVASRAFSAAFIETAKTRGSGWVTYMYAKPGQTALSQKWSYVKKVTIDGKPGLVGAGFYPE